VTRRVGRSLLIRSLKRFQDARRSRRGISVMGLSSAMRAGIAGHPWTMVELLANAGL
jgi:hypothetical protein